MMGRHARARVEELVGLGYLGDGKAIPGWNRDDEIGSEGRRRYVREGDTRILQQDAGYVCNI